ncbi:MAG: periplasmic heavy metal sensor [Humidesulfovibrio sp.]|nr:periplasmic heavy metal sensor [Humidesulfovibrio sp.]
MKRIPKILAATCAALALSSSLALAAEAPKKAKAVPAKPVPAAQPAHQMGGMMGGQMMGGKMEGMTSGQMGLAALSPEKQEIAKALMTEHRDAQFPLHQSMYAKNAELEALNAAGNGDSDKAKAVIRDIADLNAKMLMENGKFRARLVRETGLRTAPMGHGTGGGMGGMMGGKGMMGGDMKCPMMEKMMGGMQHGAAPAPAAGAAPAAAVDKAPSKGSAHDAHGK